MGRFLGYMAFAAIILAAGYFAWLRLVEPDLGVAPSATSTRTVEPSLTTVTVSEATSTYKIDVQYPQFGIPAIDEQIKKNVDESIVETKGMPANPPDMASPQNELTIRYEPPYIGPDIIAVKMVTSEYTGGAHPNSIFSGLNFDRTSGKLLLLDDVLPLIGLDVAQVSARSITDLKARLGDGFFSDGANTNPENFSSFLVSKDAVTFIFQPYQVAAYAAGPQEVSFSRTR